MADILCQNCGMPNAEEQSKCSFCGELLQNTSGAASFQPGQMPTKKTTAELEPILPQWLRDARQQAREGAQQEKAEEARIAAETPTPAQQDSPSDFLAGLAAATREDDSEDIPDWMRGVPGLAMPATRDEKTEEPTYPRRQEIRWDAEPAEDETVTPPEILNTPTVPSWMQSDADADPEKQEVVDWLTRKDEVTSAPLAANPLEAIESTKEDLSWMDALGSPSAPEAGSLTPSTDSPESLPDWIASASAAPSAPVSDTGLPDWMGKLEQPSAAQPAANESLPDWLTAMKPSDSTPEPESAAAPIPHAPAFFNDELTDNAGNVDNLFAIEMPDWLSKISPTDKTSPAAQVDELQPPAAAEIAPASLPSWVQAMRPAENVTPGFSLSSRSDQPRESEGPLAGLMGVLPAAPSFVPSGRPKALSIRLQPSEAQQTGATLLDQMLEAETNPRPMRTSSLAVSQRSLRWLVAVVLIVTISLPLLLNLQIVPLPALARESALSENILQKIPEGAPALVIFDYEPALAGEMNASATAFIDSLISLRHPRLNFISTSPTGAALAERFVAGLRAQPLVRGEQFTNLGYLPGGTAGILAFAQNLRGSMPLNSDGLSAWDAHSTATVNTLADYAVIILITDQSETARAWVEQTGFARGGRPMLIVSSAQAAPMIRPYLNSGQVNGLVVGLRDGAAYESSFPDYRGPASFYWSAYNLSMLGVLAMIVLGALWNLFVARRARRSGLDEA